MGLRRRFGCFIALMATLIVSVGVLVLWLLVNLLGLGAEGPLADLARAAGLVVLIAGLVALIVGVRLARGIGRPLNELVDAAGKIEAADFSVRVTEAHRGPGELRGLARAFNTMAARLESEDATRRRLLADVSHELRTPLAVIQGNVEALLDGVYPADDAHLAPILEEIRVMSRLIEELRTLSLAESGALPLHREPTDLAALLEDVAAAHRSRPDAASVRISVVFEDDEVLPPADIDPVRIRQVLSNLVDNSLRHVPDGGFVELRAGRAPGAEPPSVAIVVADNGPGIPADIAATAFERFTKGSASRGSGLGLAIARAIVSAHGGTIRLADGRSAANGPAAPAIGTRIEIVLPIG